MCHDRCPRRVRLDRRRIRTPVQRLNVILEEFEYFFTYLNVPPMCSDVVRIVAQLQRDYLAGGAHCDQRGDLCLDPAWESCKGTQFNFNLNVLCSERDVICFD